MGFALDMRRKIIAREEVIASLELALSTTQRQVAEQTLKFNAEARRAEVAERTQRETEGSIANLSRSLNQSEERPPRRSCWWPSWRPRSTC